MDLDRGLGGGNGFLGRGITEDRYVRRTGNILRRMLNEIVAEYIAT